LLKEDLIFFSLNYNVFELIKVKKKMNPFFIKKNQFNQ